MPQQPLLRPYWKNRAYLAVVDDLLLYDECIVVQQALRLKILDCIHHGHLGISKCCTRAPVLVWWPGLSTAMEDMHMIKACFTCAEALPETKEPLLPSSFPNRIQEIRREYEWISLSMEDECTSSPSQLLMGRRLRTQLPVLPRTLVTRNILTKREEVARKEEIYRSNQKQIFDRRHQVQALPDLTTGDSVWIRD